LLLVSFHLVSHRSGGHFLHARDKAAASKGALVMELIKKNPWIVMVAIFGILIIAGIALS